MPGKMCNILHNRLLVNYLLPQDTKKCIIVLQQDNEKIVTFELFCSMDNNTL